ncbi:MAG: hypothetical protein E7525_01055 [Ruminococcaceae bacterium]|nr:hypothetical protein [Oscillospiraceae bacterium]
MVRIGARQIMITMSACMFGAGFISGQELWQFFGSFGTFGIICLVLGGALTALLTFMTVHCASIYKTSQMDRIIIPFDSKFLIRLTGGIELSFMFCIYVIMLAGAGTLIENMTGSFILRVICSCAFCFGVVSVSLKGIGSAVKTFDLLVPIMVVVAIIIGIAVTVKNGFPSLNIPTPKAQNPLLSNPILSMLTFVSYNFFCTVGTFAFLGKNGISGKRTALGSILGGIVLTLVGLMIIVAILAVPGSENAELPLLYLAGSINTPLKYIVAITLLIAMFGASVSVYVPIPEYLANFKHIADKSTLISILISLAALGLSFIGFSDLISVIYPIYGYISFAAMIGITANFIKALKKGKK